MNGKRDHKLKAKIEVPDNPTIELKFCVSGKTPEQVAEELRFAAFLLNSAMESDDEIMTFNILDRSYDPPFPIVNFSGIVNPDDEEEWKISAPMFMNYIRRGDVLHISMTKEFAEFIKTGKTFDAYIDMLNEN